MDRERMIQARTGLARKYSKPVALLALAAGLGSGLSLDQAPQLMLALHLVAGLGAIGPLSVFLYRHWWQRRGRIGRHGNARYGYLTLATVCVLLLSGLALLPWTNWPPLARLHGLAAGLLVLDLAIHGTWRWRRRLARPKRRMSARPGRRPAAIASGAALLALVAAAVLLIGAGAQAPARASSALAIEHNSLGRAAVSPEALPAAAECGQCHGQLTAAWGESAHAHAATDAYYQALATLFMQEKGVEAVRYCAECHNPIGLMRGEIDVNAQVEPGAGAQAYEARALGVSLAMSDAAAEGVTCVVCHRAEGPGAAGGAAVEPLEQLESDLLGALALRARPDGHRRSMSPDVLAEAELCRRCHNLASPDGLLLEPTYDEWLASPYPAEGIACQDCHMPEAAGAAVDSTVGGLAATHGGFPGAPSSLEGVGDNPGLLKRAATLELAWQEYDGRRLAAVVSVTNSGAGHYLPTGADDLRQVWLEVILRDAAGQVIWQSGALGPDGRLPEDVIRFGKVLGDEQGRPVTLHRFWAASQILEDTRLAPRERRAFRFDFATADPGRGPYTLTARLLYRDVPPGFAEFALEKAIGEWPPIEMARAELMANGEFVNW